MNDMTWEKFREMWTGKGRLARLPYFLRGLAAACVAILAMAPFVAFVVAANSYEDLLWIPLLLIYPFVVWFQAAQAVKRLHDVGQSGWLYLLAFVPVVSGFFQLWLLLADGQPFTNKYGDDPKGRGAPAFDAHNVAATFQ